MKTCDMEQRKMKLIFVYRICWKMNFEFEEQVS